MRIQEIDFLDLFQLESHGPDTYVGVAVSYPWATRLYGGQVVAQSLRAAALTVPADRPVHSLHAYFIRSGTHSEPIRFEVERLRDGSSFSTRQVVARQSSGAILNLSVSFHQPETEEADVPAPGFRTDLPDPDDPMMSDQSWGNLLMRRSTPPDSGLNGHWIRLNAAVGEDPIMQACALAFMSDAAPSRAARLLHPELRGDRSDFGKFQGASLDHALWFHRPLRVEEWHWFEMSSHGLYGARGIATGDAFAADGTHVATLAQQVLLRHNLVER